ncbi:MFS transporter [Oribacterium sp. WCC10]|uniref:MFS transporter n=1 Tax=Oribacterium sp. WCC10 TaxID=1855343 RepID=UPI0008E1ADED|nr:MFS transporter [Oribacterium sp. WCC10]SFG75038.1 Predicted arabinose efflux permease, MFS family [Oribacterium sp. WCC10]
MRNFFRQYIVLFLITLISAAGFCALSYLTVLQFSIQSEEQYISTCNSGLINEIETSLTFGKKLSNYYGLSQVLSKAQTLLPEGTILTMTSFDNGVLATTKGEEHFIVSLEDYGTVEQTIHDDNNAEVGVLTTYYDKQAVKNRIIPVMRTSVIVSIAIIFAAFIIIFLISIKVSLDSNRVAAILTTVIMLQGAFLTVNYSDAFEETANQSIKSVASYVSMSVNNVLDKGVHIDEIEGLDTFLNNVKRENTFIKDIRIEKRSTLSDSETYVVGINETRNDMVIAFDVSEENIRMIIIQMVLMFAATSFLSIIVMKESLTLHDMIAFRHSKDFNTETNEQFDIIAKSIRYGNYLTLTFDYMCLSFAALQIKEWNRGFMSMPPAMAAALSISICQIADLMGMFAMPSLGKKIKAQYIMTVSSILLIFANANCFFTHSVMIIILMRFLSGVGAAGLKQVRNMIISQGYANEKQLNQNLQASNNGIIAGLLCGMGLGGVIAVGFGYQTTFLVAGIGYIVYLIFAAYCIPWKLLSQRKSGSMADEEEGNLLIRIFSIFRSVSVWRTIFMIVVPQYFMLMIIVCLIPGRIQRLELPGVVLTYSNLLNGVVGLYVGERLYKVFQRVIKSNLRIYIVMLITGAGTLFMLDIPVYQTFIILLAASLVGIVDGVGSPVATDLFMGNAYVMKYLNDTEVLMLYSVIGSAVMAVAPFMLELCEKSIPWMYGTGLILLVFVVLLLPSVGTQKAKK